MKILVYGAGVIGSLYAAKLQEGRHDVTVLARGDRLTEIDRHGLVLEDIVTGARTMSPVRTTKCIAPDDQYDLAMVMVRRDQLASVMPELSASRRIPTILFMLNNPVGSKDLVKALGRGRVLLGFPGAGGTRDNQVVRYAIITQQPTTLGELDGRQSPRTSEIAAALRGSGFPTKISHDMDAWLKAHAFFVTAICGAIYLAGGDCRRLSSENATLELMMEGVREGFSAVRALGLTITPFPLRVLFTWLPKSFVVSYWRRFFASEMGDYVFGRHARAAAREMRTVADDCRTILEKTGTEARALRELYGAIDEYST